MRIEDVKIGMRVKYEYDGEVDYGVVKRVNHPPQTCDVDVEVWCDWEEKGAYLWSSPEYITPAEENTPKFKVGDKVVLAEPLSVECSDELRTILSGVLTVSGTYLAQPESDGYICTFSEIGPHSGYSERDFAPYTEPKKTAEEIAPMLWTAYRDVLNDEALAALRQVIEDVDNHEKCNFRDSDDINVSFRWDWTSQDHDFWEGVYDGEYDKAVTAVSNPETGLSCAVSEADTGSAATKSDGGSSDYYKVPIKLPIELFDAQGNKVDSVTFEMQDIIYAVVGGEWTLGNILKACRRAWLDLCGKGKAGTDVEYDSRKIVWMGTDFLKRFGSK